MAQKEYNYEYDEEKLIRSAKYDITLDSNEFVISKSSVNSVKYSYDAWGVCTITQDISDCNIATINPFRYRGYYYDEEIGLYYVSNRYYNPEIRRWLSCDPLVYQGEFDETAGILSTNIYSYCANNPINYYDLSGESLTGVLIGVLIGAILGAAAGWGYAKYFNIPKNKTWKYIFGGAIIGAIIGGCAGYALSAGRQGYVHVFITASAYGNMQSVFNSVEMQVIAELGLKIIWHFVK